MTRFGQSLVSYMIPPEHSHKHKRRRNEPVGTDNALNSQRRDDRIVESRDPNAIGSLFMMGTRDTVPHRVFLFSRSGRRSVALRNRRDLLYYVKV